MTRPAQGLGHDIGVLGLVLDDEDLGGDSFLGIAHGELKRIPDV
jgi:hypothetical protein